MPRNFEEPPAPSPPKPTADAVEQEQLSGAVSKLRFDERGDPITVPPGVRASVWAAEFFLLEKRPLIVSRLVRRFLGFKWKCKDCGAPHNVPGESSLGKFLLERTDKFAELLDTLKQESTPLGKFKALAQRASDSELEEYKTALATIRKIEVEHGLDVVADGCQLEEATD